MRVIDGRIETLDFGNESVTLDAGDAVVLAVPPYTAASLVDGLEVPNEFRAIVNAHFRIEPPAGAPPILGVLNGTVEWIFNFNGRVSITISAGDRLIDTPREELARKIWDEVASVTGLPRRSWRRCVRWPSTPPRGGRTSSPAR